MKTINEMKTEFLALARERYSCRAYSSQIPESDALNYVLECARLSPSACNRQPWRLMIIGTDDEQGRDAVISSYCREWISSAPMFIIVLGDPAEGWVRSEDNHSHIDVDCAIITEHICLAATEQGLGTCWVCNFDPEKLSQGLNLSDKLVPVVIVPIGYPAEDVKAPEKKRKSLEEILLKR